jgi:O-antigen/teichoic acid export membrane protein
MRKTRRNSIAKNIIHLFYSTAISSALYAIALIVLASYLESYHYGVFSVALAFAMIMGYFTDAGLSEIVLREGSKKEVDISVLISSYIKMRGALLVLTFVGGFLLIYLSNSGNKELIQTAFYLIIPMVTGIALQSIGITFFQLSERMQFSGLIRIVSSICLVSTLALGIYFSLEPLVITVLYGMSYLTAGGFAIVLLVKNIRLNFRDPFHKGLLQNLGSFTIGGLLFVMLPHLGPILLEKTISLKEVGLFAIAYRIPQALQQIPFIVAGAYYPVLFKAFNNNLADEHHKHLLLQIKIMAIVGMLMTIPFFHLTGVIITILFGEEWAAAAILLKILSVILLLQSISIALGDGLTTSRRQFHRMIVQALAVISGIVFYVTLSRTYGVVGAAYAGVIIETISLFGFWLCIPNRGKIAKKTILPYLIFFFLTLAGTELFLSQFPFLSGAVNILLVSTLLYLDKDLKGKISSFIQSKRRRKTWEVEKKQGVHHGL